MTTDPRLPGPPESRAGKPSTLPRVAALPGAERRILRKRLEWPLKVIRKRPKAAGHGSR